MQIIKRIAGLLGVIVCSTVIAVAAEDSPASVVNTFCLMELQGATLNGTTSPKAWALTTGEEEPFMAGDEVATACKVSHTEMISTTKALVTVQFEVIGRLIENADGTRQVHRQRRKESSRLEVIRSHGLWKIEMKSLMHEPVRVTPDAWAAHFHSLIETNPSKKTTADRKLEELVKELARM